MSETIIGSGNGHPPIDDKPVIELVKVTLKDGSMDVSFNPSVNAALISHAIRLLDGSFNKALFPEKKVQGVQMPMTMVEQMRKGFRK